MLNMNLYNFVYINNYNNNIIFHMISFRHILLSESIDNMCTIDCWVYPIIYSAHIVLYQLLCNWYYNI